MMLRVILRGSDVLLRIFTHLLMIRGSKIFSSSGRRSLILFSSMVFLSGDINLAKEIDPEYTMGLEYFSTNDSKYNILFIVLFSIRVRQSSNIL